MNISAKDDSLVSFILLLKCIFSRLRRENDHLALALVNEEGTSKDQQSPDVREAIFIGIAQSRFHRVWNVCSSLFLLNSEEPPPDLID